MKVNELMEVLRHYPGDFDVCVAKSVGEQLHSPLSMVAVGKSIVWKERTELAPANTVVLYPMPSDPLSGEKEGSDFDWGG